MAGKSQTPLQKHTVNLFEGDFERLGDLYPDVDKSLVLRKVLRKHIQDKSEAQATSRTIEVEI